MSAQATLNPIGVLFKRLGFLIIGAVVGIRIFLAWPLINNKEPIGYTDISEHFKYDSIGTEIADSIPYWI